jgi:hypothetical protein
MREKYAGLILLVAIISIVLAIVFLCISIGLAYGVVWGCVAASAVWLIVAIWSLSVLRALRSKAD